MTPCLNLPAPSTRQPAYVLVSSLRRPVFLINSRSTRFSAALRPFFVGQARGHPLYRSYGVILPSSFTRVLSSALGSSPRLPVSVLVRAPNIVNAGLFWETPHATWKAEASQAPPLSMSPSFSPARTRESHDTICRYASLLTSRPPSDK